jgi:hypothetical protein
MTKGFKKNLKSFLKFYSFQAKMLVGRNFYKLQSNSVITNSLGPAIFVRYNRVKLCAKMTNLPLKSIRYNRVFVNNQVRYNRVSLYLFLVYRHGDTLPLNGLVHRSRETRINFVFQFAPEKLGCFETKGWNFLVF